MVLGSPDPAHDQPGGDLPVVAARGERGVAGFGDLGVGDPAFSVSSQIASGYWIGVQACSGMLPIAARDRRVLAGGDGEPGTASADRGDHLSVEERRVGPDHDQPGRAAPLCGGRGRRRPAGQRRGRSWSGPLRSRVAAITGAETGVEMIPINAFSPFTFV